MSSSSSRLTLRQLACWLQVVLLGLGMVQPVSGSQVLPRLETETVTDPEQGTTVTAYAYDAANNRASKTVQGGSEPGFWQYDYNAANQLVSWRKLAGPWGTLLKEATLGYDANGNRSEQRVADVATLTAAVTQYSWDAQDRLIAVEMPDGQVHGYEYDYRTRRMGISRAGGAQGGPGMATAVVFSGGLSLAEWESTATTDPSSLIPDPSSPIVHYTRGPDMGGGVGGLLYSRRGETLKYNLSNGRGDIVAQTDSGGSLTWTASYEAYGKRTKETGENTDKQRANTKDEDPTGLLNEGFRYRDLETGVWLSRDPAGFVDGPNLYAYVKQNPWTAFDPKGLATSSTSGNNSAAKAGKEAHKEFQEFRGGKETQVITSSAKQVRTDALVITETHVSTNELKPLSRLENASKKNSALRQLADQMDGAARAAFADGKKVVGELWGWSKVNGKTVFTKVSDVAGKHGGKIGAAVTLASAATAEGGVLAGVGDAFLPNTKALVNSGQSGTADLAKGAVRDIAHNLDPGIGMVVNRENAESFGRGFSNALISGSGDYGDYSQSTKYDMSDALSNIWSGIKNYITGK
jgi:RHS repeat-associated protein